MCRLATSFLSGIKNLFKIRRVFFFLLAATFAFMQSSLDAQTPAGAERDTHAVWVASHEGLIKFDPADNSAQFTVPEDNTIRAIAVDSRNLKIWVLSNGKLTQYDFKGTPLQRIVLPGFDETNEDNAVNGVMEVNHADGVVWLGLYKKLLRYGTSGELLGAVSLSARVESISFDDANARAWIATETGVDAYDAQGTHLGAVLLGKHPHVRAMVYDNSAGQLWVATRDGLAVFTSDGAVVARTELEDADKLYADLNGGVWALAHGHLYRYDKSAWLVYKSSEEHEQKIALLAIDPSDRSLWLADKKDFYHLSDSGQVLYRTPLSSKIIDIAVYTDIIPPEITISAPSRGSYTNNNAPVISLGYSDIGSGVDPSTISIDINGAPVSASCTPSGQRADCTLNSALADGLVSVSASVKDYAGNPSGAAKTSFTVDTVPPKITLTAPVNGSIINNPLQTISGTLSEAATLVFTHRGTSNGVPVVNSGTINVASNNAFSHGPIAMAEGSNEFTLTATDQAGNRGQVTASVTLDTVPPAAIMVMNVSVSFPAGGLVTVLGLPGSAEPGSTVTIVNNSTGLAVSATASAAGGFTSVVNAAWWDVLTLTATDAAGNTSPPVTVQIVMPPPPAPLGLTAAAGDAAVTVDWQPTTMTDSYNLYYSTTGAVTTADTKLVNVTPPFVHAGLANGTTYTYAVSAVNSGGESPLSVAASARPLPPIPAAPDGIAATAGNGETSIAWNATAGADSYTIYWSTAPGVTKSSASIPSVASPYLHAGLTNGNAYYYAVSAQNLGGEGPLSVEVNATPVQPGPALPPDPAKIAPPNDLTKPTDIAESMAFLYTGPNAIQQGGAPGTIEARRMAVIRGKVITRDGTPLPGVTVTIKDHPEFGSTLSRADGTFDMAVNGGGVMVVKYDMAGWLPVQRSITAQWVDFVNVDDVALVQLDPQVTTIDLANTAAIQVAQGSVQTDADGSRQATMLFQPGTTATMTMPDGTTRPLTTLNVRATEYTVGPNGPSAMPGELPATTGYTYAAEFSVDEAVAAGAKHVQFSQPVYTYVDNFVNMPVGSIVPHGVYEPNNAAWVGADDGIVIGILSVNAAGLAEVDVAGTGVAATAAQLTALGMTDVERQKLAQLYQPGKSLWRMPMRHFCAHDYNFLTTCAVAGECKSPNPPPPSTNPQLPSPCQPGSIIECTNQVLGERVDIAGTGFSLNYRTSRTAGNKSAYMINIPLTKTLTPGMSMRGVELTVEVAGQYFTKTFSPVNDLSYTYVWDGKDGYGRPVQGVQPARITIGYQYNTKYVMMPFWEGTRKITAWVNVVGVGAYRGIPARDPVIYRTTYTVMIGSFDFKPAGLGGWSISPQHAYDPARGIINKGDGTMESVGDFNKVISTAVGRYPATALSLDGLQMFTFGPDGSIYYSEGGKIVRVKPDNTVTVIAGGNGAGYTGDGGPATLAKIGGSIPDIAVDSDGAVYFVNQDFAVIRKVAPDGIISTVAGTGSGVGMWYNPPKQDGIPATQEPITPTEIEIGPDKYLYLIDNRNGTIYIRKIGPDGIITTLNAVSSPGSSWWDGMLGSPSGMVFDKAGNLYYADTASLRIKRITPNGIIEKIAGAGCLYGAWGICYSAYGGDGGSALIAYLWPMYLAIGPDGTIYSSEPTHFRIRGINQDGVINTVFGKGNTGNSNVGYQYPLLNSPDGTPATDIVSLFNHIAVGPDGNLYYFEVTSRTIRKVNFGRKRFEPADSLIPSNDGAEIFVFSNGRHIRTLDGRTSAVKYELAYDANGLLASVTDAYGNITTVERDAQGKPLAVVSPYGQRTALSLDANGYLASATGPAGSVHAYTYFADGLMTSYLDPNAGLHTFSYDVYGLLLRDTNPAGGFWNIARYEGVQGPVITMSTAEGRNHVYTQYQDNLKQKVLQIQKPDGTASTSTESPNGSTTVREADGAVSTVKLGPDSRWGMHAPILQSSVVTTPGGVVSTTSGTRVVTLATPGDPLSLKTQTDTTTVNGKTYTSVYDNTLKTVTATSPAGRQSVSLLDAKGKVTKSQTPGLADVNYAYDARGRLAAVSTGVAPDTRTTSLAYGADGNVASVTDAMGGIIGYTYDGAGRVTSKTLKDGRIIAFTYDANGNVTSITPPSRPMHQFAYNGVDMETLYSPPAVAGGGATQYAYNLDKQLTMITRPDGQAVVLGYDIGGRLAAMTTPSGNTVYGYSATSGHLQSVAAPSGETLSYVYDGFLPLSESWSGPVAGSVARMYNSDFRVTSLSVNGGSGIPLTYDLDGLLAGAGSLTIGRSVQTGFVTSATLGGTATAYAYNTFGELASERHTGAGATFYDVAYTRDKLGRITQRVETIGGVASTYGYVYDAAGRLVQVSKNGAITAAYAYDMNGNRIGKTDAIGTTAGSYDAQDRLFTYGANSYTYTANGELLTKTNPQGTTTYSYDVLGNLTAVTLPDGTLIEYVIDGSNRRVGKKINGALVQGWLYANQLNSIAELDGAGNVVSTFVYGTKSNVPDYMVKGGITYRIISDHLGSPVLVVDSATGTVAQQITYDEFGNIIADTNPGFISFGFAGGLYDQHTKLVRFGARDYDAESGRWTSKDPIRFSGGDTNLYGYVVNDPVNFVDPLGLLDLKVLPQIELGEMRDKLPVPVVNIFDTYNDLAKPKHISPVIPGTIGLSCTLDITPPPLDGNPSDLLDPNKYKFNSIMFYIVWTF